MKNWIDKCYFGDCRDTMRAMIADGVKVQTIVTSPPYYGLRDYGHDGQIGLEDTPALYIEAMVSMFSTARDLLADDGVLWLNIGDTSNNRRKIRGTSHQPSLNGFSEPSWAELTKLGLTRLSINNGDLKEKDMMGIPWMLAFALRADGWYLRQEIIWSKSFGKPEPSVDRLPNRHEQIFLMSKSKNYKFNKSDLPEFARGSVWRCRRPASRDMEPHFPGDLSSRAFWPPHGQATSYSIRSSAAERPALWRLDSAGAGSAAN